MSAKRSSSDLPTIGIAGLSHLGLVTGLAIASKGFTLVGYDPLSEIPESLRANQLPIYEEGLSQLLEQSRSRITWTSDPQDFSSCQVIYIARDVPTDSKNESDPRAVRELFELVARNAPKRATLVMHSQISPGTSRYLLTLMRTELERDDLTLLYQVETLVFGIAVSRALQPERYIIGCENPASALPEDYLALLSRFDCPRLVMRYESAELAKIAINLFLVSSVVTSNLLADLCERIGADWDEIVPALRLDKRIGPHAYLKAGLGIAGGNLERDLVTVSRVAKCCGAEHGLIDTWSNQLAYSRDWVFRTVYRELERRSHGPIVPAKIQIAVWGIAYKPDTHSTKNAPSRFLLRDLKDFRIDAFDPQATLDGEPGFEHVTYATSELEACRAADLLIVLTPWRRFCEVPAAKVAATMRGKTIIDPFAALSKADYEAQGFAIVTLGKR